MVKHFIHILLILQTFLHLTSCANILAITTLASPSHHVFNDVYLLELADRGHNVTLLGHDEDNHRHPNYTYITMEGVYKALKTSDLVESSWELSPYDNIVLLMWDWHSKICNLDVQTQGFKKLLSYPDDFKFDLVVWDTNNPPCLYPFVEKFGRPPVLGLSPFVYIPNTYSTVFQSHLPLFLFGYTDHMSYFQRLKSNFWKVFIEISREYYYVPKQEAVARNAFGEVKQTVEEFERNISLVLMNHNPVFHYVQALPPNMIPIGGLHITPPKELTPDLKKIMDDATNGVVLMSFGSNIGPQSLGPEKIKCILNTFSRLPHTFIWKFGNESIQGIPKNVHIIKWVPQKEILAHPNTVLFITHGGGLSCNELMHFGVPAVGIPFFLDQMQNIGNLKAKGVAEKIDFQDIEDDKFFNVIIEVLNNPSYRRNAKRLSRIYRDRENEPMETAMYWTEYLLRHGSAAHLDIATRDMNFVQFYNLDLAALLILPIVISVVLIAKCIIHFSRKRTRTELAISKKKTQ